MAKKIRKQVESGKLYCADPLGLNRWCIEMAMSWPSFEISEGGYGAAIGGMTQFPRTSRREDADIIARAVKIKNWVQSAS